MSREIAAHELETACARMRWRVESGGFVLAGFPEEPLPDDLAAVLAAPGQMTREGGETTLLARAEHAGGIAARHPGARIERDLVWIRFEAAMAWDLVGFLALVAGELAREGVPIGAVCGFSRDHVFVPRKHLPAARRALVRLFPEA
jgi:hypothetical protein